MLAFLLKLNLDCADKETKGVSITPPGLPSFVTAPASFISADCVSVEEPDLGTEKKSPPTGKSTPQSEADAAHFYSAKEEPPPCGTK